MVAERFYVVTKDWSFSVSQNSWNTIQFQCLFSLESWKQRQIQIYFSLKIVIGLEWQNQPERDICFHIQCTCSFNVFLQNGREIKNYSFVSKSDCKGKRFAHILSSLLPLSEEQRLNTRMFLFAFCSMVLCMNVFYISVMSCDCPVLWLLFCGLCVVFICFE